MTKTKQQAVPWGQPAANVLNTIHPPVQDEPNLGDVTDAIEAQVQPEFAPAATDEFAERIKSAFTGQPVEQASPFAPKPKAAPAPEPETFELGDAPSWGVFVQFIQAHGRDIVQAHYPKPLGAAVDTIFRGVTVIAHPRTEVRHVKLGWIRWEDAQYKR